MAVRRAYVPNVARKAATASILNITQPVFWLAPGVLSADVSTRDYRDDFYEFGLCAGYAARLTADFMTGLDLSWRRVEPADDDRAYSAYTATYLLSRRVLDDARNPSRGVELSAQIGYTHRRYGEGAAKRHVGVARGV